MNTVKKVIEVANIKTTDLISFLKCKLNKCMQEDETVCIAVGTKFMESRNSIKVEECEVDPEHLDICGDHNYELHINFNKDTEITYDNEYEENNLHIHQGEVDVNLYFI